MATLNTAQHFGLERELGSIAPGRRADVILTSDLPSLPMEIVIAQGRVLARDGKLIADIPAYAYPAFARNTVKLKGKIARRRFRRQGALQCPKRCAPGSSESSKTRRRRGRSNACSNCATAWSRLDIAQDIAQIALIERHRASGQVVNAFVTGFGYDKPCAVASTVAHDCHQMIVVGTSKSDMAQAANRLAEIGGGIVVISEGQELALVELPIAGLMSDERAEIVAAKAKRLVEAMRDCGCQFNNAFMQHSLLALAVIPELRISDKGLVDVTSFKLTELFV